MSRAKAVNGVKHASRCACPLCDPQQTKLARARAEALEQRRLARLAPPLPAVPLAVDRPRMLLPAFETEKTRRFRELVRDHGSRRALEIMAAEFPEV